MNKSEFLAKLKEALAGLPKDDVNERLAFYSEMIDDRVEEGLTEAEAVEAAGPVDEIVKETLADIPLQKLVKEKVRGRRMSAGEIVLIVLGAPLWFPLLVAAAVLVLAFYIVIWSLVLVLWVVWLAFCVTALACIVFGVFMAAGHSLTPCLLAFGAGLLFAGLALLLFPGCVGATKGMAKVTKATAVGIKKLFIRKGTTT